MKLIFVRSTLVISGVAALLALLFTSLQIQALAPYLEIHFERHLGREHFPPATGALLAFAPRAPHFAAGALYFYLMGAVILLRTGPSPEACAARLLMLNTAAWVLCVLMHIAAFLSVALPI